MAQVNYTVDTVTGPDDNAPTSLGVDVILHGNAGVADFVLPNINHEHFNRPNKHDTFGPFHHENLETLSSIEIRVQAVSWQMKSLKISSSDGGAWVTDVVHPVWVYNEYEPIPLRSVEATTPTRR
jgi:hypothetical protein